MILDDRADVITATGRVGTVACHAGHQTPGVVVSMGTESVIRQDETRIMVSLPLADADTGAPLSAALEDVTAFQWRGRRCSVEGVPVVRRRHGEDHHARWTVTDQGPV